MPHDAPLFPVGVSVVFIPDLRHQIFCDIIFIVSIERRIGIETSFEWLTRAVRNNKNDLEEFVEKQFGKEVI